MCQVTVTKIESKKLLIGILLCGKECISDIRIITSSTLTCVRLSLTVILTKTLLGFQFFQPSRRRDSTEWHTESQFRWWHNENAYTIFFYCFLIISWHECFFMSTVTLCSYPPSVPLKGGSTSAAPARWGAVRGERESCDGDCATSSRWLCLSSLCLPSSVESPFTDPPPPVLLFNWALGASEVH